MSWSDSKCHNGIGNVMKWQEMSWNDRKCHEMTGNDTSGNVRKLWQKGTSRMKLEKTFHDEIEQLLKLGCFIKVIPWTARASSRSKKSLLLFWFALLLGSSEYFLYPISSFLQLSKTKIQLCTPSIVWPCSNSILTVCDKTLRKRLKELSLVVPCR